MKTTIIPQAGIVEPLAPQVDDPWFPDGQQVAIACRHHFRGLLGTPDFVSIRDQFNAGQHAPELLAALELCLRELEGMHSYHHPTCPGGCPFNEAAEAARVAIQLAKG